eukprot:scaffold2695_cov256-Chaetoceros_neogracile.AAC.2
MRFTKKSKSNMMICCSRKNSLKGLIALTIFILFVSTATFVLPNDDALQSSHLLNPDDEQSIKTIEIAVAYCSADITWLTDVIITDLYNDPNRKIVLTMLSKCGNHEFITQFLYEKFVHLDITVRINQLPNKGGCDLAYAYFINDYIETGSRDASSAILFLKDTERTKKNCHQKGRYLTIPEMLHSISHGEFVCGVKASCGRSAYHDTSVLKKFAKHGYKRHGDGMAAVGDEFNAANYVSLDDFITRELKWTFPNDAVTEVCYGGSFGIPASRLFADQRLKQDLLHLEELLREGPAMSVVEHFAERLWASFLAKPLDKLDTEIILRSATGVHQEQERYMGTFLNSSRFYCFFFGN